MSRSQVAGYYIDGVAAECLGNVVEKVMSRFK